MIKFLSKVVRESYKKEPNKQIVDKLEDGDSDLNSEVSRLMRTSSFNRQERGRIQKDEESSFRSMIREQLKKKSNIDCMHNMLVMRKEVD